MRNQFEIIKEAVGVPQGIHDAAVNAYERLVHKLGGIEGQSLKNQDAEFDVTIRGNFNISDMELKTIKFQLKLFAKKTYKNIDLVALRLDTISKLNKDFKLEILKQKTVKIDLIIQIPNDEDLGNIQDYFINNKFEVIEGLVHELKHSYDFYKDNLQSPQKIATYQTFLELNTGIKPIDDFLHYCYYISLAENLVRPTELVSAIKNNQISQKDFVNFLTNNQTYKELKEIQEFSFQNMVKELSNYPKEIDKFLKKRGIQNLPKLSQKKKIQELLEIVYDLVSWTSIEKLQKYLSTEPIEFLLGFQGDKEKLFQDFVRRNQRFNTPIEFFKFYENHFGKVSSQMIKKISKVYSLLRSDEDTEPPAEDEMNLRENKTKFLKEDTSFPLRRVIPIIPEIIESQHITTEMIYVGEKFCEHFVSGANYFEYITWATKSYIQEKYLWESGINIGEIKSLLNWLELYIRNNFMSEIFQYYRDRCVKKVTNEGKDKETSEKWIKCDNCNKKYTQTIYKGKKSLPICPHCGTHNQKQEQNESELTERCWKGYTQKGMKTMFGKRYPNCVKKKK